MNLRRLIRCRLRFSVRTLGILVTLICVYFGLWEATERYSASQVTTVDGFHAFGNDAHKTTHEVFAAGAPAPLIVYLDEQDIPTHGIWGWDAKRNYYVWLLGPRIRLPFESDAPFIHNSPISS